MVAAWICSTWRKGLSEPARGPISRECEEVGGTEAEAGKTRVEGVGVGHLALCIPFPLPPLLFWLILEPGCGKLTRGCLMWVSRLFGSPTLCMGSAFSWRKCFVLLGTGQLSSSRCRTTASLSMGAGGTASWDCVLNYVLGDTGALQFFLHGGQQSS